MALAKVHGFWCVKHLIIILLLVTANVKSNYKGNPHLFSKIPISMGLMDWGPLCKNQVTPGDY